MAECRGRKQQVQKIQDIKKLEDTHIRNAYDNFVQIWYICAMRALSL